MLHLNDVLQESEGVRLASPNIFALVLALTGYQLSEKHVVAILKIHKKKRQS